MAAHPGTATGLRRREGGLDDLANLSCRKRCDRDRQALEINDNIVQGLSVAKYALEQGQDEKSEKAVEETLKKARAIITELLGEEDSEVALGPGELRRQRPATVPGGDAPT